VIQRYHREGHEVFQGCEKSSLAAFAVTCPRDQCRSCNTKNCLDLLSGKSPPLQKTHLFCALPVVTGKAVTKTRTALPVGRFNPGAGQLCQHLLHQIAADTPLTQLSPNTQRPITPLKPAADINLGEPLVTQQALLDQLHNNSINDAVGEVSPGELVA